MKVKARLKTEKEMRPGIVEKRERKNAILP